MLGFLLGREVVFRFFTLLIIIVSKVVVLKNTTIAMNMLGFKNLFGSIN